MWFINDITIKEKGHSEAKIISLCKDNNIQVGNGWYKQKWLGRIISDTDYHILMSVLGNEA